MTKQSGSSVLLPPIVRYIFKHAGECLTARLASVPEVCQQANGTRTGRAAELAEKCYPIADRGDDDEGGFKYLDCSRGQAPVLNYYPDQARRRPIPAPCILNTSRHHL